jgi:PTH1 family peptidyl-tRNA hydrolase
MNIIAGLGNPGSKYNGTRHNIGLEAVEYIIKDLKGISLHSTKLNLITYSKIGNEAIALTKTKTYMNHSGKAIRELLSFLNMPTEKLIILYDDMDLSFGEIRIKNKGSGGGHNGMQSVIEFTGTNQIARLKIGIGRPFATKDPIQHVLGRFTPEEKKTIPQLFEKISLAIRCLIQEGIENAMNRFN